jgi:putative ABC transport system permease protein
VARDGKYLAAFEPALPYFYVPLAQRYSSRRALQIRCSVPPESLASQVERVVQALDPEMPISDLRTMRQSLAGALGFFVFRLGAYEAGAMGMLGLALAVVGVYGVVSYAASQRTREIGIRMALGADPGAVRRLVLRQGAYLVIAGVLAGLAGAWALARAITSWLFGVIAADPLTFTGVTLLLAAIALWACYVPARRAMRVDPMVALRHE